EAHLQLVAVDALAAAELLVAAVDEEGRVGRAVQRRVRRAARLAEVADHLHDLAAGLAAEVGRACTDRQGAVGLAAVLQVQDAASRLRRGLRAVGAADAETAREPWIVLRELRELLEHIERRSRTGLQVDRLPPGCRLPHR